jgi:hypothetical protein
MDRHMTGDMFQAAMDAAGCKAAKGLYKLPDERFLTLYAAHDGVSLTVTRVIEVDLKDGQLLAENHKGEVFVLALDDVFAASVSGAKDAPAGRKAGFLG